MLKPTLFLCIIYISICTHCLLSCQWPPLRSLAPTSSILIHHILRHFAGFSLTLLFSRLTVLALCLFLCVVHFVRFIIFMALHWIHLSLSMSLFYWVAQTWTRHSRCRLTRAEQRRMITSLNLFAMLFLISNYRFLNFKTSTILYSRFLMWQIWSKTLLWKDFSYCCFILTAKSFGRILLKHSALKCHRKNTAS